MHNLHFIVVNAESGEDACSSAEETIGNFGNENNWYVASGAVSEDNDLYSTGEGRYPPKETLKIKENSIRFATDDTESSMQLINKLIKGWLEVSPTITTKINNSLEKHLKGEELQSHEWYDVKSYAEEQQHLAHTNIKNFNVLQDTYFEYQFADRGVTQNTGEEGKLWVVFVDMHS